MKKSLLALAVLVASGTAMAQSSVTLFGTVDMGVGHISGSNSVTGVAHSGNTPSRLGFRGTEDLGGGLKANFHLEGGITADTGTGQYGGAAGPGFEFKRRSTVSLSGGFGEIRLGRELAAGYAKPSSYDPFNQVGIGTLQSLAITAGSRVSNGVTYITPNLGGLSGQVHYGFGEVAGNSKSGRYVGLMGAYDNGPLSVTLAGDRLERGTGLESRKSVSLGASYDLGVVKPAALYFKNKDKLVGGSGDYDVIMLAASAPIGAGKLVASVARYDVKRSNADSNQLSLGYVYDLSKRTAVYGTASYMKNKNGATRTLSSGGLNADVNAGSIGVNAGKNVSGYQVGIRHNF